MLSIRLSDRMFLFSLRGRHETAVRYRRRTFTWQGEVRVIREGFEVFVIRTKSVLMVRMYPSRFPRRDLPDVALLFSDSLNKEIAELSPGDWVEFEATMTLHGYRGDPELMTLWHIQKVERPVPLSSSAGHSHKSLEDPSHPNRQQKEAPKVVESPTLPPVHAKEPEKREEPTKEPEVPEKVAIATEEQKKDEPEVKPAEAQQPPLNSDATANTNEPGKQ
ncbi:unnamed protein product [Durusdinium trenchii]|uniref:Uncharacterized protein n=1 Tax=Durusdinium trenchii TaxID=1381693 RepID=A0ABP0IAJ6_9DINO